MRNERGSLAVWTALVMPAFILCVGLGVDLSGHAAAEQEARAVAQEAARAGGQYLLVDQGRVRPATTRAERAANGYVAATSLTSTTSAGIDGRITVTVSGRHPTQFLSMIGINSLPLTAVGTARVVSVIAGNEE
ncbi:MAG: TadE/TadG family type IV pilus assembly protein [Arachnia sp.]